MDKNQITKIVIISMTKTNDIKDVDKDVNL